MYRQKISAALVILAGALWVFLRSSAFDGAYIWDGQVYSGLLQKYLLTNDLSTLTPADLPPWTQGIPVQSYFNRIGYFFVLQLLVNVLHLPLYASCVALNFISFAGAAWFLYLSCQRFLHLGPLTSVAAALWLLLLPPAQVLYQVVAHPGALGILAMSLGYYLYLAGRHYGALGVLCFGILVQESVAMVPGFIVASLLVRAFLDPKSGLSWPLVLGYSAAIAIGMLLPVLVMGQTSLSSFAFVEVVLAHNWADRWAYLLNNFNVLWIPFVLGLWGRRRQELLALCVLGAAALLLLLAAMDWWRVWYGSLFFVVLPLAARYFQGPVRERLGTAGMGVVLGASVVYLMGLPPRLDFAGLSHPALWPYGVMLALVVMVGTKVITKIR